MLPETWENIRVGGGREHIKKGVLDFSLIIMEGRVDAWVSFAFYKCLYSGGHQASLILCSSHFTFGGLPKSAKRVNDDIHLWDWRVWGIRGSGRVIDADEEGRETLEEGRGRYQAK